MILEHNYNNLDEIVIVSPSSNIQVKNSERYDNQTQLMLNKIKWPDSATLNLHQSGKKLLVEVIDNNRETQLDFKIFAPKNIKLTFNVGNSSELNIEDILGNIDLNVGSINNLSCKRVGLVNVTSGNVYEASFEDINENINFEVGSGKIKIKFNNEINSDHNVYLNAGKIDLLLSTPDNTFIKNSLKTPPDSVKFISNNMTYSNNKYNISFSGSVASGIINLK
jgi:hypothetical protein